MKRDKDTISYERLHEVLHYDPDTGIFTWKINKKNHKTAGKTAGNIKSGGYVVIYIDGSAYQAHRLAWLYVYRVHPKNIIDHINRECNDNRICNLRDVSYRCNIQNAKILGNNSTGVKGVFYHQQRKTFYVTIGVNRKLKSLGYYKDFYDAVCARLAAEQCCDWPGCYSNSPTYLYVKQMLSTV